MNKFAYSQPIRERVASSHRARMDRARVALGLAYGFTLAATGQASASVATLPSGAQLLVSYESVVAYRHADGSCVATPRNAYSKTTDRSIDAFCHNPVRLEIEQFSERLRVLLS